MPSNKGKNRQNIATIPGLPPPPEKQGKKPAEKRPRQDTPSPNKTSSPVKEIPGNITDWHVRIQGDIDWSKKTIGTAVLGFKTDSVHNLA
jgi:hypothetical protein